MPTTRAAFAYVQRRVALGEITRQTGREQRWILMHFAAEMGKRPVEQIGRADVERWLSGIRHLSPGTRRNRQAIVRTFFDDLVERERIRRSPMRAIPAPKVPRSPHRALNPDQVATLLAHAPDELARCYMLLVFQCALRRAEVCGLELGDVNWSAEPIPTLFITGKGGHQRVVPVPLEAREAIEAYTAAQRPGATAGALLRHRKDPTKGLTPQWLDKDFRRIALASGVKGKPGDGITLHAGRHTAATDIYRRCQDVVVVRDYLGHQSLATTQTYVRGMDLTKMADAVEGRTYSGNPAAA